MRPIQMTKEALKYKGEWVTFSRDMQRVTGHGVTSKEASDMAKEAGEDAILFFIPEEWPGILVL